MHPETNAKTGHPRSYYECVNCGRRFVTEEHRAACDDCGGYLKNLAVPRE